MNTINLLTNGLSDLDVASTVLRVATGTFFAASGWNKLTNAGRHAAIVDTFKRDHIPAIGFMQWWVPGWELLGGAMVALGLLGAFAAGVLIIICAVACVSEAPARVADYKPINGADKLADYLYLPEVLYILCLLPTAFAGTGKYSLDHLFF
jgi:putative oxidoreductase